MQQSQTEFTALHQRGYQAARSGNLAEANTHYEAALKLMEHGVDYPGEPAVRANLADNYAALGKLDRAWGHLRLAKEQVSGMQNLRAKAQVLSQIAWFFYEHGDEQQLEEGLVLAEEASKRSGEDLLLPTLDTKMRILMKLGRIEEAKDVARYALGQDPHHGDFQDVKSTWGLDQ